MGLRIISRFRRPAGPHRTLATPAPDAKWTVRPMAQACGRPSGKAVVAGDALVRMVQELLTDLAMSIIDGDGRAEAWGEYLTALANAKTAKDDGEPLGAYLDAVADAWDGLTPELGCDLYLPLLDALRLGQQLERVAGEALAEIGRRA